MRSKTRREVKTHRATHPLRTRETGNTVNYEALYVSSNHRGTGRDSIGYEILREQPLRSLKLRWLFLEQ